MPSPEASRRNLADAVRAGKVKRLRSERESLLIELFVWQSRFESGPCLSQRALARQLGVSQPYFHKLLRRANTEGLDALLEHGQRVTLDDLAEARRFTAKLRDAEPDILAPAPRPCATNEPRVLTADGSIAEARREVAEWKRKNPSYVRRRVLFSVPVR